MLSLTCCPEPGCAAVAEVTARYVLGSTDGPIEHVATHCVRRHRFLLPVEFLPTAATPATPATPAAPATPATQATQGVADPRGR